MIVFTLPGYEVVFKVVKDRFPPQKTVTPRQVADRYQFVARHDRAGRLVEAQRFERLSLPLARFGPDVLEKLTNEASRTVTVVDDEVMFSTVYVERRVTPLDMFIREADPQQAARGIVDYGATIKNLAASNIFPGDMLLKNFGVTNSGRVVFYDYDELRELTECRFRAFPESSDPADEMSVTPVFGVGPNDVFPEELPRFLGLTTELRAVFEEQHGDLFEPDFWIGVQQSIESGETIEILPYSRTRSL
jgi:isocitrate dehydrogenase kinase/phosphatase